MSDNTAPQPQPMPAYQAGPTAGSLTGPTTAPRRLTRVREGKWLAGVCTGLARYLNVDPVAVRVGFGVLTVFSGAGLVLYVACWVLMPKE